MMNFYGQFQERVLYEAIGRTVRDSAFRTAMQEALQCDIKRGDGQLTDLEGALKVAGYELTSPQLQALQSHIGRVEYVLNTMDMALAVPPLNI